jgi:ANTAR domain-containing protein
VAADLAALPMLDLFSSDMTAAIDDPDSDAWQELYVLTRAEVSQATGILMAQLDIGPAEALVRLRAHAYATDTSATEVARAIVEQRLYLTKDR